MGFREEWRKAAVQARWQVEAASREEALRKHERNAKTTMSERALLRRYGGGTKNVVVTKVSGDKKAGEVIEIYLRLGYRMEKQSTDRDLFGGTHTLTFIK